MGEQPVPLSHRFLANLLGDLKLSGTISQDVPTFLRQHNSTDTAGHCQHVAAMARRIAASTEVSLVQAETAGWLHDVSVILPVSERAQLAHTLGIEVLPEEESCPMIVHQKLSRLMALEIFGVTDPLILDAVGCHTTLRAQPTTLDKILFIADKLAWDQPRIPPYARELKAALAVSLDHATRFFVNYLWDRRDSLLVIHPWLRAAVLDQGNEEAKHDFL